MAASLAAFRRPYVGRFIAGRFVSVLASSSVAVSVGWQIYELTHSPLALGLTGLATVVPVVGLALPAGIAADRYPRRLIAMGSHLTMATAALCLFLLAFHKGPVWAYYAALFLNGLGVAFRGASVSAMLPQLVPIEELTNINAWNSSVFELATVIGPALSGLLIALVTSSWLAFATACAANLVFVGILASMPRRPAAMTGKVTGVSDFLGGLRFVFQSKALLGALSVDLFAVLLGGATSLLPIFASDILKVGPAGLGWLRAASAFGAATMGILQTRIAPWKRPGRAMLIAVAGFGVAIAGFGLSRSMPLSMAMLFISGMCDNVSVVVRATLAQSLTPDKMLGRVSAINFVFIGLSNELGTLESGLAAQLMGTVPAVVVGGIGTLFVAAWVRAQFSELVALPPLASLRPLPATDEPHV